MAAKFQILDSSFGQTLDLDIGYHTYYKIANKINPCSTSYRCTLIQWTYADIC